MRKYALATNIEDGGNTPAYRDGGVAGYWAGGTAENGADPPGLETVGLTEGGAGRSNVTLKWYKYHSGR